MGKKKAKVSYGLEIASCYKCSDGEVFEDFTEAKTHQIRLNFCERLTEYFKDTHVTKVHEEIATDAIMKDLDELAEIFKIYLEERG